MKTAETNPAFQKVILPIIQKAETEIKTLILVAFLYAQPKLALLGSILTVINKVKEEIPADFGDTSAYVKGLVASADKMVNVGYNKPQIAYYQARNAIVKTAPNVNIYNPHQLNQILSSPKDMWAEAKGSPNVTNYAQELKKTINDLSEMPTMTYEDGKRPISIWQKAELDTRYQYQMQHLQDLRVKGEDLCYISSHPNCSKRCQVWQGSLVSLSKRAVSPTYNADKKGIHYKKSSFIVGKVDGRNVYSLSDIMDCLDIYGYHNDIICGFNCRHRLMPYKGQLPPTKYDNADVAQQRDIEIQIRELERKIRLLKTKEHLYNESGDKKTASIYRKKWKSLVEYYKQFCETNGYAWQEYRIKI